MKKIKMFLIVVFILTSGSSFQYVMAQEKTKAEQEKELKILQTIDEQKKAMTEQKKAVEEASQILKEEHLDLDENLKDIQIELESSGKAGEAVRIYGKRGARSFQFDEPFIFSSSEPESYFRHSMGDDSERTTWEFSKSVKENTNSKDYPFDVEKTAHSVVMSVMGDCKKGEIQIKIIMPNGKNYSDIVIDESGNLNWRKSFAISETENRDKEGEWKFKITTSKATGFFKISLQTY